MGKVKNEAMGRAEMMLMGMCIPTNNDEVQFMTDYILTVLGVKEQYEKLDVLKDCICQFNENKVTYMTTCRVMDMPCIVYCLETEDAPKPFEEDYGSGYPAAFCYVFNTVDHEMCSEFGDCFFEKRADGHYHRVS